MFSVAPNIAQPNNSGNSSLSNSDQTLDHSQSQPSPPLHQPSLIFFSISQLVNSPNHPNL